MRVGVPGASSGHPQHLGWPTTGLRGILLKFGGAGGAPRQHWAIPSLTNSWRLHLLSLSRTHSRLSAPSHGCPGRWQPMAPPDEPPPCLPRARPLPPPSAPPLLPTSGRALWMGKRERRPPHPYHTPAVSVLSRFGLDLSLPLARPPALRCLDRRGAARLFMKTAQSD